jgi:hypothetical protein
MVPPWRGPPFASEFAGGAVTSAGTGWLRVGKNGCRRATIVAWSQHSPKI